ncbi:MAG: S-layer protein [Candidatus Bathyarchaeia archaeon]|jgi:DNA-binding transcriptional ArsR family regulator
MSYLILKERHSDQLVPTRVFSDPKLAQSVLQPTRWRILTELTGNEKCAKELAQAFGTSEQVICYHLRELERTGFIRLERTMKKRGAMAKYYKAEQKAITIIPKLAATPNRNRGLPELTLTEASSKLLEPFISSGYLDGHIVLGSPDTHGVFRGRARCGDRATDLALFLGSLLPLTRENIVRLDTEISQEELLRNLITVGGPKVNTVTMAVNESLPITYELTGHNIMISRISGRSYAGEDEGAVQSIVNPMNREKRVIVVAGNTYQGTRAAVLAFIKYTDEIAKGNSMNQNVVARVVSGLDVNSDGLIDDVEFLE